MAAKRIGILTGGGDVPGLNSVIKTVVYRASDAGCEVIGIRRGWEGLTHVDLNDPASRAHYILPLDRDNTRTVDRTGGTFLHTSRTNPQKMKKLPAVCAGGDFPKVESTKKGVTSLVYDITVASLEERRRAGSRLPGGDWRRRHAELRGAAGQGRREGDRCSQDHGQRCAQHRVLHRILHRHHARHGRHRPAADHGGLA